MNRKKHRGGRLRLYIILAAAVAALYLAVRLSGGLSRENGEGRAEAAENNVQAVEGDAGREDASTGMTEDAADSVSLPATATSSLPAYDHTLTELEAGRAYLQSLDERTPAEMEVMIDEARKSYAEEEKRAAYAAAREKYRDTLEGDAVWSSFEDFVFLGDSRVVGFDVFGFLPSDRVLADAGDTIRAITERMDTIRQISPRYIFISYGINDIGIGFWPTAEDYQKEFAKKLEELHEALPEAEIYVNSILPAREDVLDTYPVWAGLPDYSEAVRQMCAEKEICFIDNAGIMEDHHDLYATDGVHMQPDFYPYWAENQLLAVYDRAHGYLCFPE